jgi:hypothetical protein
MANQDALLLFIQQHQYISHPHIFVSNTSQGDIKKHWPNNHEWIDYIDSRATNEDDLLQLQKELIDLIYSKIPSKSWPMSLVAYFKKSTELCLNRDIQVYRPPMPLSLNLKMNMSVKKRNEIQILSATLLALVKELNIDVIVDIGSGSGRLANTLSQFIHVLAIDGNELQTCTSQKREELNAGKHGITHVTLQLDSNSLVQLLLNYYLQDSQLTLFNTGKRPRFLFTVLHGCGDLSANIALEAYHQLDIVHGIVDVPCCYYLLSTKGFPLSTKYKRLVKKCTTANYPKYASLESTLMEPCNRLFKDACSTFATSKFKEEKIIATWKSWTWRALLEGFYIQKQGLKEIQDPILKFGNTYRSRSLNDFIAKNRENLHHFCEKEFNEFYEKQNSIQLQARISFISTLRQFLGPCMESIILNDRLHYLIDHGYKCELVNLFDFKESPRNVAIISTK